MKKIVIGVFTLGVMAAFPLAASAAAPIFQEDFSYAAPSGLVGQGGWALTGSNVTNPITVNSPGLTYAGYPSSGIGFMAGTTATSGEDDNHAFTGQTTGAVYAAFMVNVVSSQTPGDYFFHFFDGLVTANVFRGRVFVKKDAASTNYALGVQFGSTVSTVYTGFSYAPGTTHLVVLKYTFNAGANNDQVSLFVDPATTCTEGTATVSAVDAGQPDAVNLDALGIRQGSATAAPTLQLDGIRVAANWADAVCAPTTPVTPTTWGSVKSLYR